MSRTTMFFWSFAIFVIGCIIGFQKYAELHKLVEFEIEGKYKLLMVCTYIFSFIASFLLIINAPENETKFKQFYLDKFDKNHYNFLYTYHILYFAAFTFYLSEWPWCVMSVLLFLSTNYMRRKNNSVVSEYNIEKLKNLARSLKQEEQFLE